LDSLIAQTYTDFEVILVDDASPDGCPAICDEYAAKDSRFKAIHHQENRKVSAARNTGLDHAASQYITFADADDYCYPDYLETMINLMETHKADMVITGYCSERDLWQKREKGAVILLGHWEAFRCKECDLLPAWCKLYKRSIIKEHVLRFDEAVCHKEDQLFVAEYLQCANKAVYTDKKTYRYRMAPFSASARRCDPTRQSAETALNKMAAIYGKAAPEHLWQIFVRLADNTILMAIIYLREGQKAEAKQYLRKARLMVRRVCRDDHALASVKLRLLLKVHFYWLLEPYNKVVKAKFSRTIRQMKDWKTAMCKDKGEICPK
jgi:glycosyltransferase involved in cell wall biosynthesis